MKIHAEKVDVRSIAELVPYARNSRTHSPAQIKQIEKSIQEFGWTVPVLVDEAGTIIAGHGRVMAASNLGIEAVPVVVAAGWTDDQKRAYIIADNKIASNADWDKELLALELSDLKSADYDLGITGFNAKELVQYVAVSKDGLSEEDEVPEPLPVPLSASGDVWLLGAHRVMCGSATVQTDVEALMDGAKADMVFTDPPYNTGMGAKKDSAAATRLRHMFDDSYTDDEWQKFMADFCASYDIATKPDCFIFVCLDWRRSHELVPHLKRHWHLSNLIVWDKMVHGLGSDYKYCHEFIHVCKKGKPPTAENKEGEREYYDIWHIQRKMGRDEEHATKKPIELCERPIRHTTKNGDIVLDLFGGSGSTLIACEKLGRACRMMELDPKYVDVIVKRWQAFTGKQAVLESNGKTFDELANARN